MTGESTFACWMARSKPQRVRCRIGTRLRYGFTELGLEEIVSFTVPANLRSRALMEKLGMREDTGGAFAHPALAPAHPLSRHLLYRLRRTDAAAGG